MRISNLKISAPSIHQRVLTWDVENKGEPGTISILRSNSPEGPYEEIATISTDSTQYVDETINPHVVFREFYYKLRLRAQEIGPATVNPVRDRIAQYIIRLYQRALQRSLGTPCKIYVRKTSGERCPDCWDEIHGRVIDSNCKTCLGTGYKGGYYNPIETLVSFPEDQDSITSTPVGELSSQQARMPWITNYPLVHPGDLLVRLYDKTVWRIDNPVIRTAKRLYVIRQQFNAVQLSREEVEYWLNANSDQVEVNAPASDPDLYAELFMD